MKFSIGDKVLLKRTMEEAEVYSIISLTMVEVVFENTIFPVFTDEIDHPYLHWFTQKKNTDKKKLQELPLEKDLKVQVIPSGFHIMFIPQYVIHEMEEQVSKVKVYLLNGLKQELAIQYKVANTFVDFQLQSQLYNNQSFYVHDLDFEAISANPNFTVLVNYLDEFNNKEIAELQLKLSAKKLAQHLHDSKTQGVPSFQFELWEQKRIESKVQHSLKPTMGTKLHLVPNNARPSQKKEGYEHYYLPDVIDIHIEKLVPHVKGMNNAEILQLQLKHAMHALDHANAARKDRLTIIHGVGEGVLKERLHALLKTCEFVKRFENNWQQKFGFGATEVYLK